MSNFIKKYFNILIATFVLLQPILDLMTGLSLHLSNTSITIGILIRVLFLIFISLTTLFVYKNKKVIIPYSVIGIYSILYLIGIIIYKDGIGLFSEIQGLVKTFYFPIILVSLYYLKDNIRISKMTLLTTLIMYLLLIFIPTILGIGFKTYQITKAGTLGFFNSANEISGIISLLTPIMFIIFYRAKNKYLKILLALIYLEVILMMGTKTPLLSLIIVLGLTIIYLWKTCIKTKRYEPIYISIATIIIGIITLIMIIPQTTFYKNIETHLNFLKVDDITEVFEDEELIDHFIFSQRLTFMEKKDKVYDNSSLYQKLFGIGYLKNNKPMKLIEMDYFDIYYSHGLIGFVIFFTLTIYILYKVLREKQKLNYERYMLYTSLLLIIFLAFFTGHIITAPSVSFLVVILILQMSKRNKKDLLFGIVNLNVGGIEKAQINLLNNINYNKYNVTLVMEEKKGELLNEVNNYVKIKEIKVSNNKNKIIRKITNLTRKIIFTIYNYENYDFSCCYATYSYSSNKLTKIASKNSSIYIHSNYKDVYDTKEEYLEFFNTRKLHEFRKIIFVSNESAKSFVKDFPNFKNKIEVFNNFIDIEKITIMSKQNIKEKKSNNKKLFVFVGRLDDSSKKISRAIKLIKEIKDTELWIIGDGPDKEKYETEVEKYKLQKNVKFLGQQLNPYPYMKEADYIILTSDYEGFPVIYLEAIALNKKIITTIDVSDDSINMGKDYANIISKNEKEMLKEVEKILEKDKQPHEINLDLIQKNRIKNLEKLFNEVI